MSETILDSLMLFSQTELSTSIHFNDSENQIQNTCIQAEIDDFIHRTCKIFLSVQAAGLGPYSLKLPYRAVSESMLQNMVRQIMDGSIFGNSFTAKMETDDLISIILLKQKNLEYIFALLDTLLCVKLQNHNSLILQEVVAFCFQCCLRNVDLQKLTLEHVTKLLKSICNKNAEYCGSILEEIQARFAIFEGIALGMFKCLPIRNWTPSFSQINELENMLKDPLASSKSVLARYLIENINWNNNSGISLESRKHLALSIVNTYLDYDGRRKNLQRTSISRALFSSAVEMTQKITSVPFGENQFLEFYKWCWSVLTRLDCYSMPDARHSYPIPSGKSWAIKPFENSDSSVLITVKGFAQSNPLAAYLILHLSEIGQNYEIFKKEGFRLLKLILESRETIGFLDCAFSLFSNFSQIEPKFYEVREVQDLFNLVWRYLGNDIEGMVSFMKHSLEASSYSSSSIQFWDQLVLFDDGWSSSAPRQQLMDILISISLEYTSINQILKDLNIKYKAMFFKNGTSIAATALDSIYKLASSRLIMPGNSSAYPNLLDFCALNQFSTIRLI